VGASHRTRPKQQSKGTGDGCLLTVPQAGASSVRQTKSKKVSRDTVLRGETKTLDAPATQGSVGRPKAAQQER
jgi:hypothetical protein